MDVATGNATVELWKLRRSGQANCCMTSNGGQSRWGFRVHVLRHRSHATIRPQGGPEVWMQNLFHNFTLKAIWGTVTEKMNLFRIDKFYPTQHNTNNPKIPNRVLIPKTALVVLSLSFQMEQQAQGQISPTKNTQPKTTLAWVLPAQHWRDCGQAAWWSG